LLQHDTNQGLHVDDGRDLRPQGGMVRSWASSQASSSARRATVPASTSSIRGSEMEGAGEGSTAVPGELKRGQGHAIGRR
jgi:hypothetical protein